MTANDEHSQPEQGQAAQLSGALHYHLVMLGELFPWTQWFDTNGPASLKNACLESYLTHARLLIEFIAGRPTKESPLRRRRNKADFQPASLGFPEWELSSPTQFDMYLDLMDKHLSHLSLERAKAGGGQLWPIDRIANPLLREYGNFADQLGAKGNSQCAIPIKTGVAESVALMAKTIYWPPNTAQTGS
jgi:hypothetical protein